MPDTYQKIYSSQADAYHRMIAAEDTGGNLAPALREIVSFEGKNVLDLGSGTGRIPLLIAKEARRVAALDLHADMLRQNMIQRDRAGGNWSVVQGDMLRLPFASGWADVVTAGWAIGHLRRWLAPDWKEGIGRVLREMIRVSRPDGTLIILETFSTGSRVPAPPTPQLAEYYAWLEEEWGFQRRIIQTDYQFASVEDAVRHTEFFFGPDLAARIRAGGWARVPEWTGVWRRELSSRNRCF